MKWYDVAKGYGFMTPGDGLSDIFCHGSVLRGVGLDTLLDGATITCEVVQGDRGPQVARIHAVDFSTASVMPAPGNGQMREQRVAPTGRAPLVRTQEQGIGKMVRADEGLRVPGA